MKRETMRAVITAAAVIVITLSTHGSAWGWSPERREPRASGLEYATFQGDAALQQLVPYPLPVPTQPQPPLIEAEGLQLVGFTTEVLSGGRGVLNYTLACQREFGGSRMCTVSEVSQTLFVPATPPAGYAWVQPLPEQQVLAQQDCEGWTSMSMLDSGTTVALGAECYGGIKTQPCGRQLPVACCADADSFEP
ncbi:MAG: hypothetical protein JSV80_15175 [Acidobacteriota bacterium]|nr:MAG: hypothetical protein JSV80_15175 [Acidobacteriota bacterium]